MDNERRFKAWNIADPALNREANGHHYWEAKSLVDELRSRGETVRLFSHRDAPAAEQFPGVEIIPTFSLHPLSNVSNDPVWSLFENFIIHARALHGDLVARDRSHFHNSITLFPTLRGTQLLGIFRWLTDVPQEIRPKTAVCLRPPPDWSDRYARLHKMVWNNCPPALRKEIALFCRTPQVAAQFKKHMGIHTRVLPVPLPADALEWRPSSAQPLNAPMVVSFVGGARPERGRELVADVVEQCSASGVRFFIQAKYESVAGTEADALSSLAGRPYVRVQQGALERDDYYRAIADSVVLLAYDPVAYRWRDSGVYREALMLGAPVLVSAGTSIAEEVKRYGNGLIIEDFTAPAIVDCIERAQRELPVLRAAAARVAEEFRRTQGVARYIPTVVEAFRH